MRRTSVLHDVQVLNSVLRQFLDQAKGECRVWSEVSRRTWSLMRGRSDDATLQRVILMVHPAFNPVINRARNLVYDQVDEQVARKKR